MKLLSESRWTIFALVLVLAIVIAGAVLGVDFIHSELRILERLADRDRADDVLAAIGLVALGMLIDRRQSRLRARRQHEEEIQEHRLRVLKATMRTVQDIVNNFLNNLQLIQLDMEELMPPETAELFERLIADTAAKLKALGDLQDTPEKPMASGMGIDFNGASSGGNGTG